MATHSSILAWKTPSTEEPGRSHTVHGDAESDMTEYAHVHYVFLKKIFNLFIWLHWVLVVAHGNLDLSCRIGIFSCCV